MNPQAVSQRVDAYRGNPQALMQKYAVSQELVDLLALQQINKEKQEAARQMQLQMAQAQGQQPPTVAEQLERETFDLTRQEMAQKMAPVADMQRQQQMQRAQAMQGIASNPAPNISPQGFAQGGIVGYAEGGDTEDRLEKQRREDREALRRLFGGVRSGAEKAGRAILDVASLPLRGVVGAYDTAVVRPMRAAGLDAAYLSPALVPEGADPSSMTPFYDVVRDEEKPSEVDNGGKFTKLPPAALEDLVARALRGSSEHQAALQQYLQDLPQEQATVAGLVSQAEQVLQNRAKAPQPTARTAEMRPADAVEERGTGRLDVPEERMPARATSGLEALYEKQLTEGMSATPDYSQLEEYRKAIIDPTKDIQRQRQAALQQRQQEAAQMRDKQLAAMQDDTPDWLRYLQHATASIGTGPNAGLRALSAGAVSKREEDEARALKRAEVEQKYMDLVNQLTDAGFGTQEAMIKADEILFGKRSEADKTAAERRNSAFKEIGEELRSRRSAQTQRDVARTYADRPSASGSGGLRELQERHRLVKTQLDQITKEMDTPIKEFQMRKRHGDDYVNQRIEQRKQLERELQELSGLLGGGSPVVAPAPASPVSGTVVGRRPVQ